MVGNYNSTNLAYLRFLIISILGFAGVFRISELLDIRISNIKLSESCIEIFLEISKCDQIREGNIVYISSTETRYCPVFWLNKYLYETNLVNEPDSFLICRLAKTSKGYNVHG